MSSTNQNVGFVGFITRKDKDTGVNLLAKIVTPNKKRSLNKLVRVKIKANALDDYSCCVIDHAAMKKMIEESQDLESVSESFQFLYNGEHGTNISYAIDKLDDASTINQFLSEDGTLLGRPKYKPDGSADAVGYIRITVTKNDAEVSSRIMVRIKSMTANEVLHSDKVYSGSHGRLDAFLWDGIVNGTGNTVFAGNGYTNITNVLYFNKMTDITNDQIKEISDVPIKCEWTVVQDDIADFIKSNEDRFDTPKVYKLPMGEDNKEHYSRICMDKDSPDYGKIYQPTYKETCENFVSNSFATLISNNDGASNRRFRIGKTEKDAESGLLILRARLTIEAADSGSITPIVVQYRCGTTSKPMSNKEVKDFVQAIMKININGSTYDCDSNVFDIVVPDMSKDAASATPQTISVFSTGHFINLPQDQRDPLMLGNNTLQNVITLANGYPTINKVNSEGSNKTVSTEEYGNRYSLFEGGGTFEQVNTNVDDDMKRLTIPVGSNTPNNTGMYKASEIINTGDAYFGLRFKYTIQKLNDGEDEISLDYTKIFRLKRASSL